MSPREFGRWVLVEAARADEHSTPYRTRGPLYEQDRESRACAYCRGPLGLLGTLGDLDHYQCRTCGLGTYERRAREVQS